jgi:EAL domain-containing protein (putative c-di-GMP-specific phosphodiesterase class I)
MATADKMHPGGDPAALAADFDRALGSIWIAYQPIVWCSRDEIHAFEALLRSGEPALPTPVALLAAAGKLGRSQDIGRAIRERVAAAMDTAPVQSVFVNLLASDLLDEQLYAPEAPLSRFASMIVIELSNRATPAEVATVKERTPALHEVGFRLAIDDVDSSQTGLIGRGIEPDVVKVDMALVRGLPNSTELQNHLRAMTAHFREKGIAVVAKGVETNVERDAVLAAGCYLLQGYLFAKPDQGFASKVAAGSNRRIAPRVTSTKLGVRLPGIDKLRMHRLRDISETGALVESPPTLPKGTEVKLELCGEAQPLKLVARVVREVREKGERVAVGVHFVGTAPETLAQLRQMLVRWGRPPLAESPIPKKARSKG